MINCECWGTGVPILHRASLDYGLRPNHFLLAQFLPAPAPHIYDESFYARDRDDFFEIAFYAKEHNPSPAMLDLLWNDMIKIGLKSDATDEMDFSSAFKYFRNCNGSNSTFNWNNNVYSTILLSEIKSNEDDLNQLNDDSNLVVDKKHLKLQNHIIGDNSNIE